jgi:hypothetical protein
MLDEFSKKKEQGCAMVKRIQQIRSQKTMVVFFAFLCIAVLVLSALGVSLRQNRVPLWEPPGPWARLSTYLTTNVAVMTEESPFPELRSPVFDYEINQLYQRTVEAIQDMGWVVVNRDEESTEITAIVQTPLWGFKDDVVVRVLEISPGRSSLWIRSSSRVGKGDLGANTRHILDLLDKISLQ